MSGKTIIGWDFGTGRPVLMEPGGPSPEEIVLVAAHPTSIAPTGEQMTRIRIWNLFPTLKVCVTIYRRIRMGKGWDDAPFMESQVQGKNQAFPVVRTKNPGQPEKELGEIPPTQIWLYGGQLEDGCEIGSAMQGVDIITTASLLGPSDHDVVATIVVKAAEPLGCVDLAEKLIQTMKVEIPSGPLVFT